jgi:iron complex outermembrane receptor protein
VINIVPQDGAGEPSFEISAEGGSLGLFREQGQASGGFGKRGGYSFAATRLDVNEGVHGDEVYRNTTLGGRMRYSVTPRATLRGTVHFADAFGRITGSPFPIGPAGSEFGFATGAGPVAGFVENELDLDSFRDSTAFIGSIVFSHEVGRHYNYLVSFQSVNVGRDFENGPDQTPTAIRLGLFEFVSTSGTDGRTDTFSFTNNLRAGRSQLITIGLEAEREQLSQEFNSPFFSTPRTSDRQRSFAFFAQDQASLLEGRLQLSAAVRTQSFSLRNPESIPEIDGIDIKRALTGDVSIAYIPAGRGTKLRAHAGNSFRSPSLSERFSLFRGDRVGNPFLRPERAVSIDGGIDQQLFGGRVKAAATYFYSRLQEVITSTSLLNTTNGRGGLSRGVELSVAASPAAALDLIAAYTYTNSAQELAAGSLRSDNVRLPAGASSAAFSIPRHAFSLEINHRFKNGLNLNFDLYAASSHEFPLFDPVFFSQVITGFEGYAKADIGASYTRGIGERRQVTFYGKVDNVFDVAIFEEGFRVPGAVGAAGLRVRF